MTCTAPASHPPAAACPAGAGRPRRRLVLAGVGAGASALLMPLLALPTRALADAGGERSLALHHTHTGERLAATFAAGGRWLPQVLAALDRFLRDHYSGAVGRMDAQLFEQLHALQARLGSGAAFEVISAYRSPHTNEQLRRRGGGGVARGSLHLQGRAIDVRLPGVPLAELRDAALDLRAGGVGYYARERFVHLDTGRPRSW